MLSIKVEVSVEQCQHDHDLLCAQFGLISEETVVIKVSCGVTATELQHIKQSYLHIEPVNKGYVSTR